MSFLINGVLRLLWVLVVVESTNANNVIPVNFIEAFKLLNQRLSFEPQAFSVLRSQNESLDTIVLGDSFPNITQTCFSQVLSIVAAFAKKEEWSVRLFDSFGKPTSGILDGSLLWIGEYSECTRISVESIDLQAKYCLAKLVPDNSTARIQINYGICVPEKCSDEDIVDLVNYAFEHIPQTIRKVFPLSVSHFNSSDLTCQKEAEFDGIAVFACTTLSTIALVVTLATVFDMIAEYGRKCVARRRERESRVVVNIEDDEDIAPLVEEVEPRQPADFLDNNFFKIMKTFSFYSNAKRVFAVSQSGEQMNCLNAVRVLSMAWVILGHTYLFGAFMTRNIVDVFEMTKRFSFQMVIAGTFAVDSFFLLSGVLTCYVFLKEAKKEGDKVSAVFLLKYYFHRYWRLTPTYAIMLLFEVTLTRYIGNGPVFPSVNGFEKNMCRDSWWTNLLYVNNLVKTDDLCYGVTWYLSSDMQFHWIAPIVLILFVLKKQVFGVVTALALFLGSILSAVLILALNPGMELASMGPLADNFFKYIYIAPWSRLAPFMVGILLGYLLFRRKSGEQILELTYVTNIFGWIISLFLFALVVFLPYPDFNGHPWSRTVHVLYQSMSRPTWAIALAFVIYSNITGWGGLVNSILSLQLWTPLARLTYSAYLVHHIVLLYFYTTMHQPFFVQDQTMIYYFLSTFVLSYSIAFLISTFVEIPFIGLEKIAFKKRDEVIPR